ncbi:MAG: hypothetical protein CMN30_19030 [Sandaracinus sp.]|nr:hypothetical protein [Sandaracinus sp.]|tara:strand:- start:3383 stop:3652 length:270 start_codon:yes stop_codon:yes gene_type:complete
MTPTFKNTLVAMATAALGFTVACGGEAQVESAESDSSGTEGGEASCGGEGSCGATTGDTTMDEPEMDADEGGSIDTTGGEASCGEGSCG